MEQPNAMAIGASAMRCFIPERPNDIKLSGERSESAAAPALGAFHVAYLECRLSSSMNMIACVQSSKGA